MGAYEKVRYVRSYRHPIGGDYLRELVTNRIDLCGDRLYGEDISMLCGFGYLNGMPIAYAATDKGHTAEEKLEKHFGCPKPEGYRKSLRIFKLAEKFHIPILCIIDTLGAYCGSDGEERGQGHAIATNLAEMMVLKTPIISVLTGEGGSGGALALGVADRFFMTQNSVFSVITPDGCASILWKDSSRAEEASEYLHLTAEDMLTFGVCDEIISEENGLKGTCDTLRKLLEKEYQALNKIPVDELIELRYGRFRKFGIYDEAEVSS